MEDIYGEQELQSVLTLFSGSKFNLEWKKIV